MQNNRYLVTAILVAMLMFGIITDHMLKGYESMNAQLSNSLDHCVQTMKYYEREAL